MKAHVRMAALALCAATAALAGCTGGSGDDAATATISAPPQAGTAATADDGPAPDDGMAVVAGLDDGPVDVGEIEVVGNAPQPNVAVSDGTRMKYANVAALGWATDADMAELDAELSALVAANGTDPDTQVECLSYRVEGDGYVISYVRTRLDGRYYAVRYVGSAEEGGRVDVSEVADPAGLPEMEEDSMGIGGGAL